MERLPSCFESRNAYRINPCPCAAPYWVATVTYTVNCPVGSPLPDKFISVTRQARSTFSMEHATATATRLAKAEAELQMVAAKRDGFCCHEPAITFGRETITFGDEDITFGDT